MVASYRPSAASRFVAWVDVLPLRGLWVFPGLALLLFAWGHAILWASGRLPVGSIDLTVATGAVYGPYGLAVFAIINRIAIRSLDAFWPATGWPDSERPRWAYRFVTLPRGFDLVALAIGIPVSIGAFLSAPASFLGAAGDALVPRRGFPPAHDSRLQRLPAHPVPYRAPAAPRERIHREATAIDPFDREPVYAFSRLTVVTGLAYVLDRLLRPGRERRVPGRQPPVDRDPRRELRHRDGDVRRPAVGHPRPARPREGGLLAQAERRLGTVAAEMDRRIDAGAFGTTKEITDTLAGATLLRERVARLPTWPWPPQVLRGFLSALFAPIVVYVVARLVSAQFGT